jgi:hypothetical protein
MSRFDVLIDEARAAGQDEQYIESLKQLLSSTPAAENIRNWFKKYFAEHWEPSLLYFSHEYDNFYPMTPWERMSNEMRVRVVRRHTQILRELAADLNTGFCPDYPPVLEFFDPERAIDIIRALPEDIAKNVLQNSGYSPDPETGYARQYFSLMAPKPSERFYNPAVRLAYLFSSPSARQAQELAPIFERLADYAENSINEPKRDRRSNSGNADARAFARQLAEYFKKPRYYRNLDCQIPNTLIADCVTLKFPDLDPPPDDKTIRDWCRTK